MTTNLHDLSLSKWLSHYINEGYDGPNDYRYTALTDLVFRLIRALQWYNLL
jgi:hypothetical protein